MIRLNGTITAVGPLAVSYVDMDTNLPRTPHGEVMLYGGTFRGPLRKAAYKAVRQNIARHKDTDEREVFTIDQAYMLGEGVDTTRAIENESRASMDPLAEAELRSLNPLLSLFGRWRLPAGSRSTGCVRRRKASWWPDQASSYGGLLRPICQGTPQPCPMLDRIRPGN